MTGSGSRRARRSSPTSSSCSDPGAWQDDGVTADPETVPAPAPGTGRRSPPWRAIAVVAVAVVVAGGALGALGGWLWYHWWAPPNTGEIYDTAVWGPKWLDLTDEGLAHQFSGPAEYTLIALGLGFVLGILAAVIGRRQALVALAALIVGSALAAYLAFAVGTALSPPGPEQYATKANVGKEYKAAIEISGWTPLLCWPIGALAGFAGGTVAQSGLGELRRKQRGPREAGTWLERQPPAEGTPSDRSGR